MRRFDNFSPHDFELFVADLFGAVDGVAYETFARGRDGGIDVRRLAPDGSVHVIQCKHYERSAFSTLLTAAKGEKRKLDALNPAPYDYRFVTSKSLTPKNKSDLADALGDWVVSDDRVIGAEALNRLLDSHPEVERRQIKLWLTGSNQLLTLLNAGVANRSRDLLLEIEEQLPRFVQSRTFPEAARRLREEHVLVIAGTPGIGKTTLAHALVADSILDGYEPIEVTEDVNEAWNLLQEGAKQVFIYDDFLGRTELGGRFGKNEDDRLLRFMRKAGERGSGTRFILTTREYILRQAAFLHERLGASGVPEARFLLALPDYSSLDRARILANHLHFSPRVTMQMKRALREGRRYLEIISHPSYNPRTVQWVTGMGGTWEEERAAADYPRFLMETLDSPEKIWDFAYRNEIGPAGKLLLLVLASLPRGVRLTELKRAYDAAATHRRAEELRTPFEQVLRELDDGMVSVRREEGHEVVHPYDPSVLDYLQSTPLSSQAERTAVADGAFFFEQVEMLWDNSEQGMGFADADSSLQMTFLQALRRTFEAPALRPILIPFDASSYTRLAYGTPDLERRLLLIVKKAERLDVSNDDDPWIHRAMTSIRDRWVAGEGDVEAGIKLLFDVPAAALGLGRRSELLQAAEALKLLAAQARYRPAAVGWLDALHNRFSDAFEDGEWEDLVAEFEIWIDNRLDDDLDDINDTFELTRMRTVAEQVGAETDEYRWDEAHEAVAERLAEGAQEEDADPEYETEQRSDAEAVRSEIEAMFDELVEGAPDSVSGA